VILKEKLNIVLYVNNFLPKVGGREMVVFHLANELDKLGHQVRVLGPTGWWRYRKVQFNYPVHRWPTLRGLFSEQVDFVNLLLDTTLFGCDVIHAHNTYPTGYSAIWLKKLKNIPLVITPHGVDIQTIPEIGHGLRLDSKLRPKVDRAVQSAELLTAISANVENAILEAGASNKKIRTIPNGVDISRFKCQNKKNSREYFGLQEETKLILTVGNYERRRGHEELVKALPIILKNEPNARLIIVGKGTEVLQPLINELNIEDEVVLTGQISPPSFEVPDEDKLAEIYCSSDIYVSAGVNEDAEGLSLALLDGMAAGLQIVATDISGNRDIIKDGVSGFLVPPGDVDQLADRLIKALQDNELSMRMIAESKKTIEKYSWREIASQYVDVYRECMSM